MASPVPLARTGSTAKTASTARTATMARTVSPVPRVRPAPPVPRASQARRGHKDPRALQGRRDLRAQRARRGREGRLAPRGNRGVRELRGNPDQRELEGHRVLPAHRAKTTWSTTTKPAQPPPPRPHKRLCPSCLAIPSCSVVRWMRPRGSLSRKPSSLCAPSTERPWLAPCRTPTASSPQPFPPRLRSSSRHGRLVTSPSASLWRQSRTRQPSVGWPSHKTWKASWRALC
mmetsp:Transcript_13107/g.30941  ORF Transcript_13107/g.30941 Transcript_13107/m.30941 type:complete len:231 (-) Transcript_13107:611-1303(-)